MKFGSIIIDIEKNNYTLYFSTGNVQSISNKSYKELANMIKRFAIQGGNVIRKQCYDVYIDGITDGKYLKNELDEIGIESSFCKYKEYVR